LLNIAIQLFKRRSRNRHVVNVILANPEHKVRPARITRIDAHLGIYEIVRRFWPAGETSQSSGRAS
jgi:hypothetical protein